MEVELADFNANQVRRKINYEKLKNDTSKKKSHSKSCPVFWKFTGGGSLSERDFKLTFSRSLPG